VLSYDADEAGQRATERALEVLGSTNLKLRVLGLSGGKDPDEILQIYGAEKYRQLLEGAANDIEFKLLAARGELDLTVPSGKAEYLREAVKVLAYCSSIELDIYAGRLSQELEVNKDAILSQVERARKKSAKSKEREQFRELMQLQDAKRVKLDPQRGLYPAAARAEERLLGLVLQNPDFYAKLRDKLSAGDFVTRFNSGLAEKLFSRLEEGLGIEPELLTGALSPDELGEAMRMKLAVEGIANPWAECEGCAEKLLAEKADGQKTDVTDDGAFLGAFERMRG